MTDCEALARAIQRVTELINDGAFEVDAHWHVLVAAARERLHQLEGDVVVIEKEWTGFAEQQWPAETVEQIVAVLAIRHGLDMPITQLLVTAFTNDAVAILDALNEERAS